MIGTIQVNDRVSKMLPIVGWLLLLCLIFSLIFQLIIPVYFQQPTLTPHPVDAHVLKCLRFFDEGYVQLAKNGGYNITNYYRFLFSTLPAFPGSLHRDVFDVIKDIRGVKGELGF